MIKAVLRYIGDMNEDIYGDRSWRAVDYGAATFIVIMLIAFAAFVVYMLAR